MSEEQSRRVKIRVNASAFRGEAVSVFGAYDPDSDVLVIVRSGKYEDGDRPGFVRMTTRASDKFHDGLFLEEDYRAAIGAFFERQSMGLIQFADGMSKLDPGNQIEHDGVDDAGIKYRISESMQNGQIAVLAACKVAATQRSAVQAQDFLGMLDTI